MRVTGVLLALGVLATGCGSPAARREPPATPASRPAARAIPCSTVWTGPARGDWADAGNWYGHRLPGRFDLVCVPRGHTVVISHGHFAVGALVDGGGLTMTGGALSLQSTAPTSQIADLRMTHATLTGPGDVLVTRSGWLGPASTMSGTGTTTMGRLSVNTIGGRPPVAPRLAVKRGCSPYLPPGALECVPEDPAAERAVRATWRRFVTLVRSGSRGRAAALLTAEACGSPGCVRKVALLAEENRLHPLAADLAQLLVAGDLAVAHAPSPVSFTRRNSAWRISGV